MSRRALGCGDAMGQPRSLTVAAAMALWAALALAITLLGVRLGYGGARFALVALVLALLLAGQIFTGLRGAQQTLRRIPGQTALLLFPLLLGVLFAIYVAGSGNFTWQRMAGGLAWIEAPALLELAARGRPAGRWQDYAALIALWLPLEFHWTNALFPYPAQATHTLAILFGLNAGIVGFLFLRELDGVGYTIAWGGGFTAAVLLNFVICAAIAIPVGEWMRFIRFAPSLARLRSVPLSALGITLFTAWPEEFLFRGLLQNLLSKSLGGASRGWVAASILFGLSHLVHGFPNWRYVLLATIAGLFYGRAWSKSGSLTCSCLVHALVDTTWHALFV